MTHFPGSQGEGSGSVCPPQHVPTADTWSPSHSHCPRLALGPERDKGRRAQAQCPASKSRAPALTRRGPLSACGGSQNQPGLSPGAKALFCPTVWHYVPCMYPHTEDVETWAAASTWRLDQGEPRFAWGHHYSSTKLSVRYSSWGFTHDILLLRPHNTTSQI